METSPQSESPKAAAEQSIHDLVTLSDRNGLITDFQLLGMFAALPSAVPRSLVASLTIPTLQEPTLFQKVAIPLLLKEKALIVRAATGMGKSRAIALASIAQCHENRPVEGFFSIRRLKNPSGSRHFTAHPRIVVLTANRERAQCISECIKKSLRGLPWRAFTLYSGADPERQYLSMGQVGCDILVATPDRLRHFIDEQRVELLSLECVFLDEADHMALNRVQNDMEWCLQKIPTEVRKFVFAENYPFGLQELVEKYFSKNTLRLEITYIPQVTHQVCVTQGELDKIQFITKLLNDKVINQETRVVVCASRKQIVKELFDRLSVMTQSFNVYVRSLTNDMGIGMREESINAIRKGTGRMLVVSDSFLWMLGITVDVVVNFDLPDNPETFQQRCGLTGGYNAKGKVFTFVDKLTKPGIAMEVVNFLRQSDQKVPDELLGVAEKNAECDTAVRSLTERKIGTQNTFDWIRQAAVEEQKKETKTFVRNTVPRKPARGSMLATSTPRSKGKGLPSITF